jgi:hypothetical protein
LSATVIGASSLETETGAAFALTAIVEASSTSAAFAGRGGTVKASVDSSTAD